MGCACLSTSILPYCLCQLFYSACLSFAVCLLPTTLSLHLFTATFKFLWKMVKVVVSPLVFCSLQFSRPNKSKRHYFGACCLDVRTLTFCQLMGFPLNNQELVTFSRGAESNRDYIFALYAVNFTSASQQNTSSQNIQTQSSVTVGMSSPSAGNTLGGLTADIVLHWGRPTDDTIPPSKIWTPKHDLP